MVCFLWFSLSGYGFMDIGLPPASPSDKDIDLKVHWYMMYLTSILFISYIAKWQFRYLGSSIWREVALITLCMFDHKMFFKNGWIIFPVQLPSANFSHLQHSLWHFNLINICLFLYTDHFYRMTNQPYFLLLHMLVTAVHMFG